MTLNPEICCKSATHVLRGIILAAAAALVGCMENPNPVGSGLLPDSDFLQVDSTALSASANFAAHSIPLSLSSGRIFIGRSGDTESWGLVAFPALSDTLKSVRVQEAFLILRAAYHLGDSSGALSFLIHRANYSWLGDSVTIDTVRSPGFSSPTLSPPAFFYSVADTPTIIAGLDTALVGRWFRNIGESDSTNYGIVLEPTNANVIKGFSSFNEFETTYRPQLMVVYLRDGSAVVDTAIITTGFGRYVGYAVPGSWQTDPTRMDIRNGVSYRGILEFAAGALPDKAAIHKAVLEVSLNAGESRLNAYSRDTLRISYVMDDGLPFDLILEFSDPPVEIGGKKVYRFPVGEFVQRWVRGSAYRRFAISGLSESTTFDTFVLYGPGAADPADRPRLTVLYSHTH
ncbi:MAG: hypothetical protein WD295_01995 [Bacteroidota bacterium]